MRTIRRVKRPGFLNGIQIWNLGQAPAPSSSPSITGFQPTIAAPGDSITIAGSNFTNTTMVTFNGMVAPYKVDSDTQITAIVPPSNQEGIIIVQTPKGMATSTMSFALKPGTAVPPPSAPSSEASSPPPTPSEPATPTPSSAPPEASSPPPPSSAPPEASSPPTSPPSSVPPTTPSPTPVAPSSESAPPSDEGFSKWTIFGIGSVIVIAMILVFRR